MKLVLLGPPGAGKGTQANFITAKYSIPQISTGDILRSAIKRGTSMGLEAEVYMKAGKLVPDDVIIGVVKNRISEDDCKNGFLFDGFPRTIPQAEELLKEEIFLDFIIEIKVPRTEIIKRLSGRRIHPASGRSYHVTLNPPKVENKDDITGENLIQRDDDKKDTIIKRLDVYTLETSQLAGFYENMSEPSKLAKSPTYLKIDGLGRVESVREKIFTGLNKNHKD